MNRTARPRTTVPRRRFHALHLELVAVVAIVLVCLLDFGAAVRAPAFPRKYTPLNLAWRHAPATVTNEEPFRVSPLLFAFGTDPSPLNILLPDATPEPPQAVILHAGNSCAIPRPPLARPELPELSLPALAGDRYPAPAAPLFSEPRPRLRLAPAAAPQTVAAPSFAPVPLAFGTPDAPDAAVTPAEQPATNAPAATPLPPHEAVRARAYLTYDGKTPLPTIFIEAPGLAPEEIRAYEIDLLRRYPGDAATQTVCHVEAR